MTGELEAAALGSLSGLVRRKTPRQPAPGETCANCGTVLEGPFCHVCGQDSDRHKRSIRHLIFEALEGVFEVDGRLWRTVPALFLQPGKLARDYIEGRVVRHVPPFRMFLVALVIFLFAAQYAAHQQTVGQTRQKQAHIALLATPAGRASESAKMRQEAANSLASDLKDDAKDRAEALKEDGAHPDKIEAAYARHVQKRQARYAAALARADRVAQGLPEDLPKTDDPSKAKAKDGWFRTGVKKAGDNPDYYWSVLFDWGHRAAVLLLPIVGLSLALVYRKRRDVFLYDHLLVAMNILSFSFLVTSVGFLLPFKLMGWWFGLWALWSLVNLFQTLRGAYRSSILGAVIKTAIVWWIACMSFFVLMIGLLVFALSQL